MKNVVRLAWLLALAMTTTAARAEAQQLDAVMSRFVGAWRHNDEKAIASMIAREGASIETEAGRLGPLGARQAAAVLRTIFEGNATRGVRTRQVHDVGGSPQKGYAEVIWTALAPETTEALHIIIFVELLLEPDRQWRVTRIRLMQSPQK
jgi:hypothetical protein